MLVEMNGNEFHRFLRNYILRERCSLQSPTFLMLTFF